jgi:two-component system phosphate regulon response regulator PhoB/two-component system alkaline phosphatase synthesis response regulator PhoP
MKDKTIAIVDDDREIREMVAQYLTKDGFRTKGLGDAESLLSYIEGEMPDLIILDLMLPGMNGFEVCKKLREKDRTAAIPIIILSGKAESSDKVSGLDLGADDYVVKPFSMDELSARVRAVLRRKYRDMAEKKIEVSKDLTIDLQRYIVTSCGEEVDLTPTEFRILELLASRKGQVFTRDRILDYLWGEEKVVVERTIDVHIRHLREKLGKPGEMIKNVRGIGYKLEEE